MADISVYSSSLVVVCVKMKAYRRQLFSYVSAGKRLGWYKHLRTNQQSVAEKNLIISIIIILILIISVVTITISIKQQDPLHMNPQQFSLTRFHIYFGWAQSLHIHKSSGNVKVGVRLCMVQHHIRCNVCRQRDTCK